MTLLFGYHMPSFTFPDVPGDQLFDRVAELARNAEEAGFGLITVMDHFYQIAGVGREEEPMLEAYTTLGALATQTRRARLSALVTGVTYRNPALLAKQVTTLDVISKGRAILGIGAAWNESEHQGYGFEFPPVGQRMDRLDEALTICKLMFTEERPSYAGQYYRVDRALNVPRPVQPGGPPILVGGGGERRTLRLVAKHADISHWFGNLEELKHKLEVLQEHCEAVGRDPATITKTVGAPVVLVRDEQEGTRVQAMIPESRRALLSVATPDAAAERLRAYVEAGFEGFTFGNPTLRTPESFELAQRLIELMGGGESGGAAAPPPVR